MSTFTTKDGTEIFYNDWGSGQPIVFSHGWPLSADAFEDQMFYFAQRGYRVIGHDRRGHGRSSRPFLGNDMDTYADDLAELVAHSTPHEAQVWAVVGLSGDPSRTAYAIADLLQSRGKQVVPIHPDAPTVFEQQGYATLAEVPFPIDVVDDFPPLGRRRDVR